MTKYDILKVIIKECDIVIDSIEIVIKDKKYTYSKNITLQEIYMEHQETHSSLLSKVLGHYQ